MPFDKDAFARHLRAHALPPYGKGKCATFVREALEAAGMSTVGHPVYAKNYGPFLERHGFTRLSSDNYVPMIGDIAVMPDNPKSDAGHIEGWDGRNWISDFVQDALQPGKAFRQKGVYVIYRRP